MKSIDDLLKNYSRNTEVRSDFEESVFSKIKRKKAVRRTTFSAFAGLVILAGLLSLLVVVPGSEPDSRQAGFQYETPERMAVKEEVPVIEDVFFASYDTDTRYAIEQVSLSDDDEGI